MPKTDKFNYEKSWVYEISAESSPTSITTRRTFILNGRIFDSKKYASLRDFYSKLQTVDKEKYVLKVTPVTENSGAN
jgi:hypothetical protein